MAGLLARDSSSGRLPGLLTSDILALCPRLQRRVRGGLAHYERHPSSLSSPCGHRDPSILLPPCSGRICTFRFRLLQRVYRCQD